MFRRGEQGFQLVAVCLMVFGCLPGYAAADFLDIQLRSLPDINVRSLAASKDVRLRGALVGRPSVILVTDGGAPPACSVGKAAADLQRDFATRLSWVGVLSGPIAAEDIDRVRESGPLRLDQLFLDRKGALREALGIVTLPVLLLVDAEGVMREGCPPDGTAEGIADAARALRSLAGPSPSGLQDFRLPTVGGPGPVSFLDVAGGESTMIAFLHSRCLACARELEVLDYARQRRGSKVSFVAVILDPASDARIRGFLAAAGAAPDFILRDTELRLAGRYGVQAAPSLLVIDAAGGIVLSRTGYREEHRVELYADLMRAFEEAAPQAAAGSVVAEARRLHEEACAFMREGKPAFALLFQERIRELLPDYPSVHLRIAEAALAAGQRDLALQSLGRYLAAKPQTYDSAAVRETIAGLTASSP